MRRLTIILCLLLMSLSIHAADDDLFLFTQADRLEYQTRSDEFLWDFQGWYGSDYHKLWWKSEGKQASDSKDDTELQLLYSRATGAYYDLQFGLRFSKLNGDRQSSVAVGIQGDAPYRIEYDIAAFVSDDGDIEFRAEFERDFLLTQKLIVQPRFEAAAAFSDIPERDLEAGLNKIEVGLRLRYEVTRKFSPYVGVEWSRDFASDEHASSVVAGLRFWF